MHRTVVVANSQYVREHGGLGQNFPIGLEEGPPVFAGGNDVLQALDGWETVVSPSARVGGVVIVSLLDFGLVVNKRQPLQDNWDEFSGDWYYDYYVGDHIMVHVQLCYGYNIQFEDTDVIVVE
jgi:hypothetical protein